MGEGMWYSSTERPFRAFCETPVNAECFAPRANSSCAQHVFSTQRSQRLLTQRTPRLTRQEASGVFALFALKLTEGRRNVSHTEPWSHGEENIERGERTVSAGEAFPLSTRSVSRGCAVQCIPWLDEHSHDFFITERAEARFAGHGNGWRKATFGFPQPHSTRR